jgi:hypothetical protein
MIKSKRMRWAGHVARMGEIKKGTKFWLEILKKRGNSEDTGAEGRIIIK